MTMDAAELLRGLPGESLIREGLADVAAGRRSVAACLVAIAAPRLRRAGLLAHGAASLPTEPERELYALLRKNGGDAYARYNALLRELISFEQALDRRIRKAEVAKAENGGKSEPAL